MTSVLDRREAVSLVDEAVANGARLKCACAELGIGYNTYRRWRGGSEDARPHAQRPPPGASSVLNPNFCRTLPLMDSPGLLPGLFPPDYCIFSALLRIQFLYSII